MGTIIPKRWEMAMLLLSGVALVYTLRVNMSVAAVKMKEDLDWTDHQKGLVLSSFYWGYMIGQIPSSILAQSYGAKWVFGLSVAIPSFLTMLVPLACRHSLGMALLIRVLIGLFESATFPCVFHFFSSWVPTSEKTVLIPIVLCGVYVGEIIGFSLSGVLASAEFLVGGVSYGGWPAIFYVFGAAGMVWFPLWAYAAHESPSVHPTISKEELVFITHGKDMSADDCGLSDDDVELSALPLLHEDKHLTNYTELDSANAEASNDSPVMFRKSASAAPAAKAPGSGSSKSGYQNSSPRRSATPSSVARRVGGAGIMSRKEMAARTPWWAMLTHPVAVALMWCSFGYGWMGFTLLSEMPSYLTDILGFDLGSAGILCVFPYLALFLSTLAFARGFDYLQRECDWQVDRVRKTAMFIAYIGSATGLVICGFLPDKYAAYGFMVLSQLLMGSAHSGLSCVWMEISPMYSSQLNSIGNTISASAGILGPIVVAHLTSAWPGVDGWRAAFALTFAMCVSFTVVWFAYIKAEVVPALNTPTDVDSDGK